MSAHPPVIRIDGPRKWLRCPGCGDLHFVDERWTWNGSLDAPTFSPSIHCKTGHFADHYRPGVDRCWCDHRKDCIAAGEEPPSHACQVCHFWVIGGAVDFQGDCTHVFQGLSGIPLQPIDQGRP